MFALAHAAEEGLLQQIARVLLKLCIPGCTVKQIVNVFQLTTSCNAVAEHDAQAKNKSK